MLGQNPALIIAKATTLNHGSLEVRKTSTTQQPGFQERGLSFGHLRLLLAHPTLGLNFPLFGTLLPCHSPNSAASCLRKQMVVALSSSPDWALPPYEGEFCVTLWQTGGRARLLLPPAQVICFARRNPCLYLRSKWPCFFFPRDFSSVLPYRSYIVLCIQALHAEVEQGLKSFPIEWIDTLCLCWFFFKGPSMEPRKWISSWKYLPHKPDN